MSFSRFYSKSTHKNLSLKLSSDSQPCVSQRAGKQNLASDSRCQVYEVMNI